MQVCTPEFVMSQGQDPYVDGSPCQLPIEAPPALRSNVGSCIAA
jgi:hypothetical protein